MNGHAPPLPENRTGAAPTRTAPEVLSDDPKNKTAATEGKQKITKGGLIGQHRELRAPWAWLSHDAIKRAVEAAGPTGALVYIALCVRESKAPPEHKAAFRASALNLAAVSGLSTRTVSRWLPVLVRCKLISMVSGKGSGKQATHEPNTYRLLEVGLGQKVIGTLRPYDNETARDGAQKRNSSRGAEKKKVTARPQSGGLTPPAAAGDNEASDQGGRFAWR
jgi:hypothetical protein